MAISLLDLKTNVRTMTNTENNTGFITDPMLTLWINNAISETYDLLVESFQHYFHASSDFTLSATNALDLSALPGGFYKDNGLSFMPSGFAGPEVPIHKIDTFMDRGTPVSFSGDYRLFYVPNAPILVGDGETIPGEMIRWKELVEVSAGIMVLGKREMDTTELERRKAERKADIREAAQNRMAEPTLIPYARRPQFWDARKYFIAADTLSIFGSRSMNGLRSGSALGGGFY